MNEEKALRDRGIKVTPQRIEILSVLKNTKEHPGVDQIYSQVKEIFPAISLATVYNTVELFTQEGLIQEIRLARGFSRYDGSVGSHPHITCLKCGKVEDIEELKVEMLASSVEKSTGYEVLKEEIMYFGYCHECKRLDN